MKLADAIDIAFGAIVIAGVLFLIGLGLGLGIRFGLGEARPRSSVRIEGNTFLLPHKGASTTRPVPACRPAPGSPRAKAISGLSLSAAKLPAGCKPFSHASR